MTYKRAEENSMTYEWKPSLRLSQHFPGHAFFKHGYIQSNTIKQRWNVKMTMKRLRKPNIFPGGKKSSIKCLNARPCALKT